MRHEKRIPTILALLLLTIIVGGTVLGLEYGGRIVSKASPDIIPKEIQITNVSDTSVTISWLTSAATSGTIVYGEGAGRRIKRDSREQIDQTISGKTHYVTIRNLTALTTYPFSIISGGKEFNDDGKLYTFTTGAQTDSSPPAIEPAYGKIIHEDNTPAEGAIVYLTIGNSSQMSALVKPSGEWLIALSNARTRDFRSYYTPSETDKESLVIKEGIGNESRAITDIKHDSPVPTIVLGKTYNFQTGKTEDKKFAREKQSKDVLGTRPSIPATKPFKKIMKKEPISILLPEDEEALTTTKPLFRGTGIKGKTVVITVESTTQTGEVIVSSDGTWFWSPPENLEPGDHTVTIKTTDEKGNIVIKTHHFKVHKSGTQVLGEATPSGTIAPTYTPTPTLSSSPTISVTIEPTKILTATPTSAVSGKLPSSGTTTPTVVLTGVGILLIFIGVTRLRPQTI